MVPALIRVIEDATRQVRAGDNYVSSGPSLALSLLIEFQAEAALDALLASVSLPGEGPYDLYGDLVTEMFCQIVPSLGSNRLDVILEKIRDPKVDEFVRWSLATGLSLLYDSGKRTRTEVLEILRGLLREAIDSADEKIAEPLCSEIQGLDGTELLDLVREAFRANLISDNSFRTCEDYETWMAKHPWSPRAWTVRDTAIELARWFEVEEIETPNGFEDDDWVDPEDSEFLGPSLANDTIRYDRPHVGRNEKCRCGSGKKYKKCCGRGGIELEN